MAAQGIHSDPNVMMGKPVVEGTRITVEHILEELGAGQTIEQLLEAPSAHARGRSRRSALRGRGPAR